MTRIYAQSSSTNRVIVSVITIIYCTFSKTPISKHVISYRFSVTHSKWVIRIAAVIRRSQVLHRHPHIKVTRMSRLQRAVPQNQSAWFDRRAERIFKTKATHSSRPLMSSRKFWQRKTSRKEAEMESTIMCLRNMCFRAIRISACGCSITFTHCHMRRRNTWAWPLFDSSANDSCRCSTIRR